MPYIGIEPFGQTVRTVTTITATASQTSFTPTGGYTVGYCDVFYNGIKLVAGTDFTATDGLTVVLTAGATSGAVVEIITYGSVTITDAVRRSGDTFAGAVAINSTLAAGNTTITGNTTTTTLNAGNTAITGTATISGNVVLGTTTITANGGVGTAGQVLTSGATGNAYWSTVSTTLDSVLGSGNTTTKSLTTGALTVNGAFTTSTNTATIGTAMYSVANGNVGIGTNAPGAILDTYIGTGLTTLGDFSNSVRINGGNDVNKYVPITFGGYGLYAPAAIGYQVTTGTGNTYGDLVFATRSVSTDTRPTERVRIDSSGRVMHPYQPAFHASKSASPVGTSENPVQYDTVEFNIGSHYNNSTYRFTAPVAGRYFITAQFSFYQAGDARQIEIALKLNGGVWQTTDCWTQLTQGNNTHCNGTVAAVMNLAAGDYVQGAWVSSTATINFYSPGLRNSFSGFLIG